LVTVWHKISTPLQRSRSIVINGLKIPQHRHFMKQKRKNSQQAKRSRAPAKTSAPRGISPEESNLSTKAALAAGKTNLAPAPSVRLAAVLMSTPRNDVLAEPNLAATAPIFVELPVSAQVVAREGIQATNLEAPLPFPVEATVAIELSAAAGGIAPVLVPPNPADVALARGASSATVEPQVMAEMRLLSLAPSTAKLAIAPRVAANEASEVSNLSVSAAVPSEAGVTAMSTEPPAAVGQVPLALPAVTRPAMRARAEEIVRDYRALAVGAGLIPVPGADMLAIVGLQLKVLASLAELYGVAFTRAQAHLIVTSLLAAAGSTILARSMFFSLAKVIPGIGPLLGAASLPVAAGAITHAIGHLAIDHFEAGGTLGSLNLNVAQRALGQKVKEANAKLT
jgi:uncharacterized protein (DUF697 family)